jgi:hypothetical protein
MGLFIDKNLKMSNYSPNIDKIGKIMVTKKHFIIDFF